MKNKKLYLLSLSGTRDLTHYLVTKDIWDWVTSTDKGQRPEDKEKTVWDDTIAPQKAIDNNDGHPIHLTSGSWYNDRALQCPVEETFFDIKSLMKYCKQKHITIVDEFEGYMY